MGLHTEYHEFQVLSLSWIWSYYTNPRGSTGFGNEFAAIISGHWGERDYLDPWIPDMTLSRITPG